MDKTAYFNEHIAPLLDQIEKLAKEQDIPFIMAFEVDDWIRQRVNLTGDSCSELKAAGYEIGASVYD